MACGAIADDGHLLWRRLRGARHLLRLGCIVRRDLGRQHEAAALVSSQ
jgi:hypothetical protein